MNKTIRFKVLELDLLNTAQKINPVLVWDDQEATLIDAGLPGQFEPLRRAVEQTGKSICDIKHLILTHQDWDHIGTVPDILRCCNGQVSVYAHQLEKPYLEGKIPYLKLTPAKMASRIQAAAEAFRPKLAALFAAIPTFSIDHALTDEVLPIHGGLQIIHTPGHTPGHLCVFVQAQGLLIAGDQLRVENGLLAGPAAEHTIDMPAAFRSMQKLTHIPIDHVCCYHGGLAAHEVTRRIAGLAAGGCNNEIR